MNPFFSPWAVALLPPTRQFSDQKVISLKCKQSGELFSLAGWRVLSSNLHYCLLAKSYKKFPSPPNRLQLTNLIFVCSSCLLPHFLLKFLVHSAPIRVQFTPDPLPHCCSSYGMKSFLPSSASLQVKLWTSCLKTWESIEFQSLWNRQFGPGLTG